MSIAADLGDTLSLVNIARQAFGEPMLSELPDSRPGQSSDCLYYRALSGIGVQGVSGSGQMTCKDDRQASYLASLWGTRADGRRVETPKQFARVIEKFDGQQLPEFTTTLKRDF